MPPHASPPTGTVAPCPVCGDDVPEPLPATYGLFGAGLALVYRLGTCTLAVASPFGGRWRVTDPDGSPVLSLAPCGVDGADDRLLVPTGLPPVATLLRDRRRPGTWLVQLAEADTALRVVATDRGYDVFDERSVRLLGGVERHPDRWQASWWDGVLGLDHCVGLALPLHLAVTGPVGLHTPVTGGTAR